MAPIFIETALAADALPGTTGCGGIAPRTPQVPSLYEKAGNMAGELLGMSIKPFADSTDTQFYYAATAHQRAVEMLGDAIRKGHRAVLLTGEQGSGKTAVCRQVLKRFEGEAFPILGTCTDEAKTGLIDRLCSALNVDLPAGADAEQRAARLAERITNETSPERPGALLILDQIENLADGELDELETLCDMQVDGRPLIQMVLSGRPQAVARLAHMRLSRLQRYLGGSCLLESLTSEEIGPYIGHRLSTAGYDGPQLFDRQAVSLIGEFSRGNPDTVNRLCRAALQEADDQQRTIIDATLIEGLDLTTLVPHVLPLVGSRPSDEHRASTIPATSESTESHQAALAVGERRAQHLEERIERACARAEAVAAGLESALTLGARLGVETERHAGLLDESIQQACRLQKELAGLACVGGSGNGPSGPSAEVSEAIAGARQLMAQMHQVGEEVTDRITAAQKSAIGVLEEQRDNVGGLIQRLQGAQDQASQALNLAEQLERRVQSVLTGAGERVNAMEGLCQQADSVGQTLNLEMSTAQDTCHQVASLTSALQQARQRSVTGVADAASTTESLIAAVTQAQAASNGIQRQLSSQIAEAQDKTHHLVDSVDQRLRTTIALARETASQVDERIEACRGQSTALKNGIEMSEQLNVACQRAAELSQELAGNRERAEATAGRLDRLVSDGESTVETMTGAQNSTTALRQEIVAAQDACQRMAVLNKGLDQNRHDAETVSVEVRSATDDLRAMLADGQTAVDAVDHRLRTTISVGQETVSQVDDKMAACRRQLSVLQEQVELAGHAADRIGNLSEALQSDATRGQGVVQSGRTVLESLTQAMAEGRCEARSIGQAVESVVAQADQTIASAAAEAEQVIDQVQLATAKVVSEGAVAADAVRQRVETVIALADQDSDKIEASRTAAVQAMAALQDVNASAQRQSAELKERVETGERLNLACERTGQEILERSDRAESMMQQLQQVTNQAGEVGESLAESTMPAQRALAALTDLLHEAGPVSDRLVDSTTKATQAQESCRQEVVTAGQAGAALTDLAKHATAIAQQIEKADASARAGFAKLGEQRQAARATIERQQVMRDNSLALVKQLGALTGSAQELVQRLTDHNARADEAQAELQESMNRAAQSRFEMDGRIQAADNRKAALLVSEQTLAEFLDQAKGLQQQIQRIGTRADAFEVRLNQMLDRPTAIAAEAKSQAAQLQGVCRAVRKIFAGLSDAALQAKQRTDQFHQASRTADGQAHRLANETSQAAETLKRWVEEAVNVQRRLAASLEQAPSVAQTHPAGSLRSLSQLADKGMERSSPLLPNHNAGVLAERIPAVLDPAIMVPSDTGHVLLTNRAGPIKPAESRTFGDARARTDEVARLLEDARRTAETAG